MNPTPIRRENNEIALAMSFNSTMGSNGGVTYLVEYVILIVLRLTDFTILWLYLTLQVETIISLKKSLLLFTLLYDE